MPLPTSCCFAPLLSFCIRLLLNALQEVSNREALQHQTGLSLKIAASNASCKAMRQLQALYIGLLCRNMLCCAVCKQNIEPVAHMISQISNSHVALSSVTGLPGTAAQKPTHPAALSEVHC